MRIRDWSSDVCSSDLAVLDEVDFRLRPAVLSCGHEEMQNLLRGLDGRFVPPGPSGAPTRGRSDVLPTGRNFYSLDARSLPTPAAWTQIGRASRRERVCQYVSILVVDGSLKKKK